MERYDEFEQYIRATEPGPKGRAELWQTAIGLQKVDGLEVSDFLVETAKRHIEGEVNIDGVDRLIKTYYQSEAAREIPNDMREADEVSKNIVRELSTDAFVFSVAGLAGIHRRIFRGVMKHAGEFRQYDISKKEWVLDGASVLYGPNEDLVRTVEYDLEQERQFRYRGLSQEQIIEHLARFISGLWQIHPFPEGNTRTTAMFAIKYLRSLGYKVENDMFKAHSWYFRNALVRANYRNVAKDVEPNTEYLVLFLRNLLLGETNELRNRYLHVRWQSVKPQNDVSDPVKPQNDVSDVLPEGLSMREAAVLKLIINDTGISIAQLAGKAGLSTSTVDRVIRSLKDKGILSRTGSTKQVRWVVSM
ncbi:MAG: Fic family protein [Pseudoflavonifractor sp.]|nr:Fic family protein [Pseudoflavonifractor sp.]